MNDEQKEYEQLIQERFKQLPPIVQKAILSADVEKNLQHLAERHKLHFDQWEALEEEVQYALMGFKPAEGLAESIKAAIGADEETATALAADISKIVFEPIREELERELEHPEAAAAASSQVEDVRSQVLSSAAQPAAATAPAAVRTAPAILPATPPPPPPTEKAIRAPVSASYHAGETSAVRGNVHDDPYRESPA